MHVKPLCLLLILWFLLIAVQGQEVVTLTADSLQNSKSVELDKLNWKYHPGDDPRFADPQYDDRAWETLNGTAITLDSIPKSGWHGLGWFRLRLQIDPTLTNQPLALALVHFGASEIYLDGKRIEHFGTVGATPETEVAYNPNTRPTIVILEAGGERVLAVRHSCFVMQSLSDGRGRWFAKLITNNPFRLATNRTTEYGAGLGIKIISPKQAIDDYETLKSTAGYLLLLTALISAIGILHLFLYWFNPRQRGNLYFGLFGCLLGAFGASAYCLQAKHYGGTESTFFFLAPYVLGPLSLISLLFFAYTAVSY